jgi:O-antigen/teichoic acid export membrane protein
LSPLLGVYIMLMVPATALELVMTARKRYGTAGLAYGLSDLLRAAAFVAPAVVTRRLDGVLIGAVAFAVVRLTATLLYLKWEFGAGLRPHRSLLREQLAYALPFQAGAALWILVCNLHYYLVAAFVNAATFAIYAVGANPIPFIDLVSTPAKYVMMVRMREAVGARRSEAVLPIWHDTVTRLALVLVPLVGLLEVTGHELIPFLYTFSYAASVPIFAIWATTPLIAIVQANGVLGVYGDTRTMAVFYGLELLLMAGLVPPFLGAFGLVGAALAVLLAVTVGQSLFLLRAKRLMGVTLVEMLPWRSLREVVGAAVVAALVALAVKAHLQGFAPLALLAILSGVYAVTYLGILAVRGLLDTEQGQPTTARIRVLLG